MEELKEGWKRVKLKEIASFNSKNLKKSEKVEFINYLDTANITEGKIDEIKKLYIGVDTVPSRAQRILSKNDVVVSSVRPNLKHYGIIKKPVENMIASTGFVVLSAKEEVNSEYLYNFLRLDTTTEYLSSIAESSTTTYPSLTSKVIEELEMDLPPLETQEKIASILSSLDDKIELNNEMNKTLEEMASTLFKRWFIDFEFPNEFGEPYKSSGGKMVESELGEIPEGWKVGVLNEIMEINPKETLKKGTNTIYIDMKALSESQSIISNFIDREFTGSGTKFRNKDTLMARLTPCLENGKMGFLNFLDDEVIAWGSTEFNILRSRVGIPKELSYFIAREENFKKYAVSHMNGSSGRQRVNGKSLEEYKLPLSENFDIYEKIGTVLTGLMEKIENNRKEIQSLTQLRDTLLPKLMSGEVEV